MATLAPPVELDEAVLVESPLELGFTESGITIPADSRHAIDLDVCARKYARAVDKHRDSTFTDVCWLLNSIREAGFTIEEARDRAYELKLALPLVDEKVLKEISEARRALSKLKLADSAHDSNNSVSSEKYVSA